MKRMKLFAFTSAMLLLSVQAMAVGKMSKGDARSEDMICYDNKQKEVPMNLDRPELNNKRSVDVVTIK